MEKVEKDINRAIQHNGGYVGGNRLDSGINGLNKISKRFSFALVAILVVSAFAVLLPMAGTVEAQTLPNPTFITRDNTGASPATNISIGWERNPGIVAKSGTDAIHVTTAAPTTDYAMVGIPTDFTLTADTEINYWGYTAGGSDVNAPDEIFLFLDTTGDGEVDAILGATSPLGTVGAWVRWTLAGQGVANWYTVDPAEPVPVQANISDFYGDKVLGIALGAGSPTSPTGVLANVYLDNLTIDANGDGSPEYTLDDDTGTIEVLSRTINDVTYTTSIQDAINAALPGDTILVHDGTYSENVVVNKSLTVQAASSPVLDGTMIGGIGVKVEASNVNLTGFTIQNYETGVEIESGTNVSIIGNDVLTNGVDTGILVKEGAAAGNEAHFNNIVGNDIGVKNKDHNDTFDAENNWWGDASGPSGLGPGSSGDAVSDNVDFRPWLLAPIEMGTVSSTTVSGSDPPNFDASAEADTEVDISNATYYGTEGTITVFRYSEEPDTATTFVGDTGQNPLKFIDVHVSGFTGGTAHIVVHYIDSEVEAVGLDENSLRIYYWEEPDTWHEANNSGVDTAANTVYGDIPVSALTGTPVGAGGSPPPPVPVPVPEFSPIGLLALVGIMSIVLAVATLKKINNNK